MSTVSVTRELSAWVDGLKQEQLPPEVVEKAKLLLLDYLGTSFYAHDEEPSRIMVKTLSELGGTACSTVIGHKKKLSPAWAAFANGCMGHMGELDDTHCATMSHPGDSIIPSVLALAECTGAKGKDVIPAMVVGYEVGIRAGNSVMPSHYRKGWHPSGTFNTFAAAAASAKVLGSDLEKVIQSLGIAGAQVCGNFAHVKERGMVKDFNTGRAAFSGVISALLAKNGFTGASDIFENRFGFCELYVASGEPDLSAYTKDLGKGFKIMEVAHKPYSACRHTHSAIDCVLGLCEQHHIKADDIKKMTIRVFTTGGRLVDDKEPWIESKGLYGARFSIQFNATLVALYGKGVLRDIFDRDKLRSYLDDPKVRDFITNKVECILDDELDKKFPRMWPTIVEIETTGGEKRSMEVDYPKGEPENPVSLEDLTDKIKTLTGMVGMSDAQVSDLISRVDGIDKADNVNALMAVIA